MRGADGLGDPSPSPSPSIGRVRRAVKATPSAAWAAGGGGKVADHRDLSGLVSASHSPSGSGRKAVSLTLPAMAVADV